MKFPSLIRMIAAAVIAAATVNCAQADSWPSKTVRLIVPFAPGGNADGLARLAAQRFNDAFGESFIVENRTGAGGALAVEAVARAEPDGYTLLWAVQPQIVILPSVTKVSYDPAKDLTPISILATNQFVLVVNKSMPVKTLSDFTQFAKAQPGSLSYGTSGLGSVAHLAMAMFNHQAQIKLTAVHYRGNAPAMADVIAGHLPTMFSTLADASPNARPDGVLRMLAVSGAKRATQIPEVPTISESGYPGYDVIAWNGLMGPAGLPPTIIERLAREMARATQDPAFAARLTNYGVDPLGNTPEEFSALIGREIRQWAEAVRIAGVKVP